MALLPTAVYHSPRRTQPLSPSALPVRRDAEDTVPLSRRQSTTRHNRQNSNSVSGSRCEVSQERQEPSSGHEPAAGPRLPEFPVPPAGRSGAGRRLASRKVVLHARRRLHPRRRLSKQRVDAHPPVCGLRSRKPHTLRHTFASMLIEAGEPLTYVQQQLGHHSPSFTLAVYGHLLPRGDRRAVDRLDDATFRNPDAATPTGASPIRSDSPLLSPAVSNRPL